MTPRGRICPSGSPRSPRRACTASWCSRRRPDRTGRRHRGRGRRHRSRDPVADEHAALTYGNYLALDEVLAPSGPARTSTTSCCSSSSTRCTSCGSSSSCTSSPTCRTAGGRRHRPRRPHPAAGAHHPEGGGRPDRRARDDVAPAVHRFRGRLDSASGFQSAQFRQLEVVLGRRDHAVVEHYPEGSPARGSTRRWHADPVGLVPRVPARPGYEVGDDDGADAPRGVRRRRRWPAQSPSTWSTSTRASRSGATGT